MEHAETFRTGNFRQNMSKQDTSKSDWDEDDGEGNWDDWGDAEEFSAPEQQMEQDKKCLTAENDAIQNNKAGESAAKIKDANYNSQTVEARINQTIETANKQETNSWGIWGVLSKAKEGLENITTTVSHGLNQVIGVPDPEELARLNIEEVARIQELNRNDHNYEEDSTNTGVIEQSPTASSPDFGLNLVSGVTSLGTKVLNTGLDTLEGIGKKTMNMLQENDPLLMNKRKMLGLEPDRPNLSEILKEARNDADQMEKTLNDLKLEKCREQLRFDLIFENNCGLVHLEALEILSKEANLRLKLLQTSVSGNALTELHETINEVKELMEIEELETESFGDYGVTELTERLESAVKDAGLQISFEDIVKNWSQSLDWLATEAAETDEQGIFAKSITVLAETCALEVNKLHKIAELLLIKEHHSTADEVDGIVQLCRQFNIHLNGQTNRFAASLTAKETKEAHTHVRTLFAEMLVATQQIEKAFRLFLPILQIGVA